ncbi:Lrp/AsnC family transcriptional regulator [Nocardia implantans]|uniref:Lrp/AsnC family transcriptional regulator n=1 Tax=Nocardia implantans TaxID=3108168 RepID=A0ABU6AU06_9NOCA|nr:MULTISPECIES: Lrp/AsnC family transcriptional regulator [unclassified Nocardia]MEA3532953.1 Lrp/AsnC family transcriptional regulator [Nocardia sp. CDC192]MEB3510975.1 Lrp/AsnC family transcriptional regulator [Nocardia sp. CDC186]
MDDDSSSESSELDVLDKQIVHALVHDARIPFARLGGVLGVSEQTVARRYRALRQRGILHVAGQVNAVPLGHARWVLRLKSTPDKALRLAESLARFPDLSWVTLLSTGSEVTCVGRPRSIQRRDALLLQILPRAPQVLELAAHEVIHRFPLDEEWPRYRHLLTAAQLDELGPARPRCSGVGPNASVDLSAADEAMLTLLGRDGRAPYAQLAAATGWTAPRVARRMAELTAAGVLYFDVDFAIERMGYGVRGALWLRVRPADLDAVGRAMATHPEIVFAAATTGSSNLFASIICRDTADLYRYVTERLGALAGITDVEVTPSLRVLKQAQTLLDTDRIALVR